MTPEQQKLLTKAEHGLGAATLLAEHGYNNSAVSEAYYVMFYAVKALLLGKGLTHSKHSAVISAFGHEFTRSGLLPTDMHRWLIAAQELRIEADYEVSVTVAEDEARLHIDRAGQFLGKVRALIKKMSEQSS